MSARTFRTFRNSLDEHARAVAMAGAPRDSYLRTTAAVVWCEDVSARIDAALTAVASAYRTAWERWEGEFAPAGLAIRALEPYASASRTFFWAGVGYLCLEVVFSALLCAYYFRLPVAAAVALGIAVAVCIALAMKGLPASLTVADGHSPAEIRDKLTGLMWTFGPPHAVLVTALALSRGGGTIGDVLNTWFDPLAAVLSVATPILAALMLAAATYCGWSARAEAERVALESMRTDVKVFKAECEERLLQLALGAPQPATPPGQPVPAGGHGGRAAAAVVMTLTLAALLLAPAAAAAQSSAVVAIDIDATRSIDRGTAERVVLGSVDSIASLADTTRAAEIQVTTFADDGFTATPRARVAWQLSPAASCSPFVPSDSATLIRHRYEVEQANWTRACDEHRQRHRATHDRLRGAAVADLRTALAAAVRVNQPGCTALWDRLMAASQRRRPTVNVIFTDAEETCTRMKAVPRPLADVRLVVVVLPTARTRRHAGSTEAERFARIGGEFRDSPWITVANIVDWPLALIGAAGKTGGQ